MPKPQVTTKPMLHALFFAVFAVIIGLYTLYDDSLEQKSHDAILDLQKDYKQVDNTWKVKRALDFASVTEGVHYYAIPMILYPFVCRQRFFYYLLGISTAELVKSLAKLSFHSPRPVWMWNDV